MKKIIFILPLFFLIGCLTTSEVYLPHTSKVFHKKNCVGLQDPNPIKYPSAQVALNTEGVAPCSVCIKDKDLGVKHQSYSTPSSVYSTTTPSYSTQSINNLNTRYGYNQSSTLDRASPSSGIISTTPTLNNRGVAENGSYYGEISEATGRPKTVYVKGYYRKDGTYVKSHYRSPPRNKASPVDITKPTLPSYTKPRIAENDSYYGEISKTTGRPKTVHVKGYYRKDGTYVKGHYRSKPRR